MYDYLPFICGLQKTKHINIKKTERESQRTNIWFPEGMGLKGGEKYVRKIKRYSISGDLIKVMKEEDVKFTFSHKYIKKKKKSTRRTILTECLFLFLFF